jgi:hypothetical protein
MVLCFGEFGVVGVGVVEDGQTMLPDGGLLRGLFGDGLGFGFPE